MKKDEIDQEMPLVNIKLTRDAANRFLRNKTKKTKKLQQQALEKRRQDLFNIQQQQHLKRYQQQLQLSLLLKVLNNMTSHKQVQDIIIKNEEEKEEEEEDRYSRWKVKTVKVYLLPLLMILLEGQRSELKSSVVELLTKVSEFLVGRIFC